MDIHLRHAHKLGITDDQIREVIFQTMYYAGQPRGLFAMKRLKAVAAARQSAPKRSRSKRKPTK